MRILSVGSLSGISNTCLLRNEALKKLAEVDEINSFEHETTLWWRIAYHLFVWGLPIPLPENNSENKKIIDAVRKKPYDIVWIDKGVTINPSTLKAIKEKNPQTVLVSYSPDNMALRHNQSYNYLKCIPLYDYLVTNKSYIINDIKRFGAKDVIFVNNTFEPSFHYPRELSEEDYRRLGADVGFVGSWEQERADSICYLAKHGIQVRVFGDKKWQQYKQVSKNLIIEDHGLFDNDYVKSFKAFKICLCFLRKMNFDQQTTRTVEIPASGGFMLAERTSEHQAMFTEGKEAEFFSSNEELLSKCRYYLAHEKERQEIAQAGYRRCITSDYSNEGMIRHVLNVIMTRRKTDRTGKILERNR